MKKIVLISLLLMTLISITTVSATDENATDSQIPEMDNYNSIDLSTGDSDNIIKENENINSNTETISQNQTELKDLNIEISVPQKEIAKNERLEIFYHIPGHLETSQNLSCYIDGEFNSNLEFNEYSLSGSYYLDMENYDLGNHTLKICYLGDESYKAFNENFQFEIVNVAFIFEEKMYESDTKNIYVSLPKDARGTVTIKIGKYNKSFKVIKIEEDYYHACKKIAYNVNDLEYGTYDLEISYQGNYGNITKKANITVDYYFEIYNPSYDSEDLLEFTSTFGTIFFFLEIDAEGTITAFIDGEDVHYDIGKLTPGTYSRPPNFFDGMMFPYAPVYFNNLQLGTHTITIKYSGDDKHPAKSITKTILIHQSPDFNSDYWGSYYIGSQIPVTINLPKGNVGNFSLYISDNDGKNYKLVKSVKLADGKAKIIYNCRELGEYGLIAAYDTNYDHYETLKWIDISSIEFPKEDYQYLNRDYAFKVKLPNDATGNFSVYVSKNWGKFKLLKQTKIVNGKATIKFKTTKEATYEFRVICDSNYGFENKSEIYTFKDGSRLIPTTGFVFLYNTDGKYSMKVYGKDGKLVKNTLVNIKIASKNFKVKTNKKGITTIKIKLKAGKTYKIIAKYKNIKVREYYTVEHFVTLKTVKIKKSAKVTLKATLMEDNYYPLKGKQITFKFNGKTYKAKTNSKGIAKVNIPKSALKNLKIGKKITYQATYIKDTVKKTVKVQK